MSDPEALAEHMRHLQVQKDVLEKEKRITTLSLSLRELGSSGKTESFRRLSAFADDQDAALVEARAQTSWEARLRIVNSAVREHSRFIKELEGIRDNIEDEMVELDSVDYMAELASLILVPMQ
jgi:hypothetical protein